MKFIWIEDLAGTRHLVNLERVAMVSCAAADRIHAVRVDAGTDRMLKISERELAKLQEALEAG